MKNLVFLLSLILLLCGGCKYFKKQNSKSVEVITADTSETESTDSASYYTSMPEQSVTATATQKSISSGNAVAGKYYMIVGCFKVDANADQYAEKIQSMGYSVELIPGVNDFEMVAARSYNSYRESVSDLEKFRTEVTPNAWIYRQR